MPLHCTKHDSSGSLHNPKFFVSCHKTQMAVIRLLYRQITHTMLKCRDNYRPWCDFVLYTTKGINVQRIKFHDNYWENILLPKLTEFYDNCLAPEIVNPVHALGLPIRNLNNKLKVQTYHTHCNVLKKNEINCFG